MANIFKGRFEIHSPVIQKAATKSGPYTCTSYRKDEKGPSAIGWISEFLTGCWENATSHFDYSSLSLVDFDFAPPSLFVQLTQAMMTHMRWMRSLKLM